MGKRARALRIRKFLFKIVIGLLQRFFAQHRRHNTLAHCHMPNLAHADREFAHAAGFGVARRCLRFLLGLVLGLGLGAFAGVRACVCACAHAHIRFTALQSGFCPGLPESAGTRDSEWQWHQLGHMHLALTDNHATPHQGHHSVFTGQMPLLPPNQSTEGEV